MSETTILGYSGLDGSVAFKRKEFPNLGPIDCWITQGLDSAAALLRNGEVVAAAEEERFTGNKHCDTFPAEAMRFCLNQAGLSPNSIDYIAHAFSYAPHRPNYLENDEAYLERQYEEVYDPKRQIALLETTFPGIDWVSKWIPVPHHLAHAASAFYPSGFDEALILVADGMGEESATSLAIGRGNSIEILEEIHVPHSLGIFYGVVTRFLGFNMAMDESKVMGLAPYGDPSRFQSVLDEWVQLNPDGSYSIPVLFNNLSREEKEVYAGTISRMEAIFGPARKKGQPITQRDKDLAAALQKNLEKTLLHVLQFYQKKTGLKRLCYAGGVALNCAANGVISRSGLFDDMFVQPGAGDDGAALGAALYVQQQKVPSAGKPLRMHMPDWGPSYDNQAIEEAAAQQGLTPIRFETRKELIEDVVQRLEKGAVVAWFQGRMEFGPRALGRRSILADPRDETMRERINALVKKREAFRPFAPAITTEAASELFALESGEEARFSHMLFVTQVREAWRNQLPAITHVDGTARVQTVDQKSSPEFWELLHAFGEKTGVPMLLNTSFNVRGQPIVRTPEEAITTYLTANLDALVAEDCLFVREPKKELREKDSGRLLHECVARHARDNGDAVALAWEGTELTYAKLNADADQVANHLRQQGIGPGDCVALCIERSPEAIVSMIAVLKTGAAYLVLDPDYPDQRLAFMVEQGGADLIIADTAHEKRSTNWGPPVACPFGPNKLPDQTAPELETPKGMDGLAYILYTSGSTGKPKGVEVRHRPVMAMVRAIAEQVGLSAENTYFCVAPLSFDQSVFDIYSAFSVGARLELISRNELLDTQLLVNRLTHAQRPVLQATPSALSMVAETGWSGSAELTILSGGEALSSKLAQTLNKLCGAFWNAYGPTEASVISLIAPVNPEQVTIGQPLAGEYVRILNEQMETVPDGETGELCIGGIGLARGYRNQPKLTAERFVPDPLETDTDKRIYRTGDLVRRLPDGNLEYIGRMDNQIKLRGHRIESGEIENALERHPDIQRAVVELRGVADHKLLVAYFAAGTAAVPGKAELTGMLSQYLPDYMIPARFIALPDLPLNANNKVDRKSLPDPDDIEDAAEREFIAPVTEVDKQLAKIWTDVFSLKRVSMSDHFWELGGDSIIAMRMVARIREQFQIPLKMNFPFRTPSLSAMSASLSRMKKEQEEFKE